MPSTEPDVIAAHAAETTAAHGGVVASSDARLSPQAAGTASVRALGTGATDALPGNHASTTNARTPTAHAASHATGGGDPVTPAAIGAATPADVTAAVAGRSVPRRTYVGFDIETMTTIMTVQVADRVYFYEVGAPDRDIAITAAWIDWRAVTAGNFVAGIYRKDTGALIASTGVSAIPGAVGVTSHACSTTGTYPAGVPAVIAWGCSLAATIQLTSTNGTLTADPWYGGAGRFRYGAMSTIAGLTLPAAPVAASSVQRLPGVVFA